MRGGWQRRPRADEVSFRMLESPSGLQIANFRRAGSISAFSVDTNAYLGIEREGILWKEKEFSSLFAFPTLVIRRSRIRIDGKGGRRRLEKNSIDDDVSIRIDVVGLLENG